MTDYFADILADSGPVARTIKRGKKSTPVFIRRVTAGERLKLSVGQKMQFGGDGMRGSMEMDLGDMARNRHLLVQFCTVTEDGSQVFATLQDVQKQPDWLVAALSELASEVNADEDEAAKKA